MAITPTSVRSTLLDTTPIVDLLDLANSSENQEFKNLVYKLYRLFNDVYTATNLRDSSFYDTNQYISGQLYFPNPLFNSGTVGPATHRPVQRVVINFGALPNAAIKSVPHYISCIPYGTSFTRIYATASDQVNRLYLPIPFASPVLNQNIELTVDQTNVNITTAINYSAYTVCYVVLEFLSN